ncbi:sugar (Glycoside-Pentoside-Hexuronide) transporter [Thermincola ferriacetica]|uniref:Sugar (Glycoside-Pentoside-Hexuronide) transporter n=1 Tax=Thermincola ferriacetica TaxID=281456 RepID=A0A0L6W395_9FIRM|nr:MFS transporter [Thermincola ferriacetica]KNZ69916.1 sugar (Glycoside-Pentoside-Hexuronide) transporter [Thermincola ferriacetica]
MAVRPSASVINLFSIGETGFQLMMYLAVTYYAYFLTDVAAVGAATAGTILLIARIGDAISVPIAGAIIEKTNPRWGKYRSWLLMAPPVTAILFILMFTNFSAMNTATKAVVLGVLYVCAHFSVNLAWSAQTALIPVIGVEQEDRVALSSRRQQAVSAAQILLGIIAMPMVITLGGGNEARGFFLTVTVFAILQVLGYRLMARVSKPWVMDLQTEAKQTVTLGDMLKQIFSNKYLLIFFMVEVCILTARYMILGLNVYYFKYVAQNMMLSSAFFTVVSVGMLVGAFAGGLLAKKATKKQIYVLGLSFEVICFALMWVVAENPIAFIALNGLVSFGTGLANSVMYAVYADISEYSEWKTGKNAKGLIMSLSALPIKLGVALSGAIIGFSLAAIGYVAGAEPTAELTRSIILVASMVPGSIAALALIGVFFYRLDEKRVQEIRQEIQARKSIAA